MVRLSDNAVTSLTDPGNGTTVADETYASHVSTRDTSRPGWAYVTYWNEPPGKRFNDEVVAVKMDGSGAVERYAHYHSDFENFTGTTGPYESQDSDYDYRSEAHAVPSPDGTRIIFASNWVYQGNGGAAIQDYVIDARSPVKPPTVGTVQVDDGSGQRSMVRSLKVTFSTTVGFAGSVANAFTLTRVGGGSVGFTATASTVGGVTVVTLTGFTGAETQFGSLADGRYTLTVVSGQVSANGQQLDGNGDGTAGDNYVLTDTGAAGGLYRLYGDANGDRRVDNADFFLLKQTFLRSTGDPLYLSALDYDGGGTVDNADFFQFKLRFGSSL
jgi:hypothetical protein